jgi:hypothetical protein
MINSKRRRRNHCMSILVTAEKIYKSNIDLTVCDMKIFPVEFTASNRSWFRLFP